MANYADDHDKFIKWRTEMQEKRNSDLKLKEALLDVQIDLDKYKFGYNFEWLGIPVIRLPDDILVFQELVWQVKPKLIVEVGVARGGSCILSASLLKLIGDSESKCIGIDIDIRAHNRNRIENHLVSDKIELYETSSIDNDFFINFKDKYNNLTPKIIVLDSNHSGEHVYRELQMYSQMLQSGDYIVTPDTVIEFFPAGYYAESRNWDKGDNPYSALMKFLTEDDSFEIDNNFSTKASITETPYGYIRKK